jgi:eukaryotic-like serine/threonine-protein kinase
VTDPSRVLHLLDEALALDGAQRQAFIDASCAGDAELLLRLTTLLAAESASEQFLQPLAQAPRDRSGDHIGPWRLLRELGHGGMGTVYLAERADAMYTKSAALKLLRFDVGDLRARFVNERRILATLDHPNIARLLDAGTDAAGAPYVAMEYVEGEPITAWCDRQKLDIRARINLFLKVLDSVQSAHGRLIVHRDLKPANILVGAQGEPKLLDFGIAKLIDGQSPGPTLSGMGPLTPEYASPEQVRGDPIGTASDIYALGVLLYELVTGKRPYTISSTAPGDIQRAVCDTEPERPSTVMRARGLRIDRDLDHVILRALAKAPEERYASCAQFADDLRRFLAGDPVLATNAGWNYRAGKFLKRHAVGVALTALVAAAIIGSAAVAWIQAQDARAQTRVADSERTKAERVNQFLKDMLASSDPDNRGRNVTVAALLDAAATTLDSKPGDDPGAVAAMRITLAETYDHLGLLDPALKQSQAAQALIDANPQATARERAYAAMVLGIIQWDRDDFAQAKSWLERAVAINAPGSQDIMASAENTLGSIAHRQGDNAAAIEHYQRAIDFHRSSTKRDDDGFASALTGLAVVRVEQGDLPAALSLAQEALDLVHNIQPANAALTSRVLTRIAYIRTRSKDLPGADAAYTEALKIETELYGENHPETIMTTANFAGLRVREHAYPQAEALARRAYDAARAHLPDPHMQTANAALGLGSALYGEGHAAEAVPPLRDSVAIFRKLLPQDSVLMVNTESALGLALAQSGQREEGENLLRDCVARLAKKYGPDSEEIRIAAARLKALESGQKYEP